MKVREIRSAVEGFDPAATRNELQRRLDDLHQELFNLRFQWSTRQLKNVNRLTAVKRDIARVKTVMREKQLERQGGK